METSVRRLSCPWTVQYIWDCIAANRVKKQRPDTDKIFNLLNQQFNMTMGEVQRHIGNALTDNLINIIFRPGSRGECVLFPNEQMVRDGHDWYCFECHSGEEVYSCETCFRVYHPYCINEVLTSVEVFMCPVCKLLKSEIAFKIPEKELNVLLGYISNHLKVKAKGNMILKRDPSQLKKFIVDQEGKLHLQPKNESSSQQEQFPVNEDEWRKEHLIYSYMDLAIMAEKASTGQYKRLEEYKVDAQTIVHNAVIYHGADSTYADLAMEMLCVCNSDLTEIKQCRDCYRFENEKEDQFWFCQPCNPPHELVYAKVAEDPYRPAKVIEKFETTYVVRFFGGSHERAKVEKENIKPISANVHSLVTKRSSTWKRAIKELESYRYILESLEVVPISTLKDNDLEMDSEDDPKLNRSYVSIERTSLNLSNDNSISFGKKLHRANKSDQDNTSVATPSGRAAAGFECRSFATQTGNWTPTSPTASSSQSFTKQPSSSRDQQHFNMRLAFEKKIKEECDANKEAALRDLEIKLDKNHSEDISILKNNEKEKRKQLKKRLKEAHKIEIRELQAKYLQSLSGIEQHVRQLIEDVHS